MSGLSNQFQPTGNFRHGKREYIAKAAHEKGWAKDEYHEIETSKNVPRGGQLGIYCDGLADRRDSAGAGGALAGGTTSAAICAGCAAARTERAGEAADLNPGSLEAQSR